MQLVSEDTGEWIPVAEGEGKDEFLATAKYLAVSYRRAAFPDKTHHGLLANSIREACDEFKLNAYWLDEHCTGNSWEEKNHDIFRIADVFRGAKATVIMFPESKSNMERSLRLDGTLSEWEMWGTRVWTFPEALLSKRLFYKVAHGQTTSIALRQLTNIAFPAEDRHEAASIIDHYSGNDVLSRLQILSLLKDAIWRRAHRTEIDISNRRRRRHGESVDRVDSSCIPCPAECVYALMGFFDHRIMPDCVETEEQALARLSMANDSDRFAERMISMLPSTIRDTACWYSDDDIFGAKLWDIEPEIQVAGITDSGALVLDGCRATTIRWKGFPRVISTTKRGLRRLLAFYAALAGPFLFVIGISTVRSSRAIAALFIVFGILMLCAAPWMISYSNSGRVQAVEPWLVGVEGVLTAAEAEYHLYGSNPALGFQAKLTESPTGSLFSIPEKTGPMRIGCAAHDRARHAERQKSTTTKVFTIIDTESNTIYYIQAPRPPTVCVYVGHEGGLGRYILCSEHCDRNELHKETVLRMHTHVSECMMKSNWLAVGGLPVFSPAGQHPLSGCPTPSSGIKEPMSSIGEGFIFPEIVMALPSDRSHAISSLLTHGAVNGVGCEIKPEIHHNKNGTHF
jgi:hypothetical protein